MNNNIIPSNFDLNNQKEKSQVEGVGNTRPYSEIDTILSQKRASNSLQDKDLYHFSYDTIKFELPFSPIDQLEIKEKLKPQSGFFFFDSPDADNPVSGGKFYFCTEEDMDNAKSYESTRRVCFRSTGIVFELSAPKLSYGTNQIMQWGLLGFLNAFRSRFIQKLGIEPPPVEEWRLMRIDLSYNFELDSFQEVERVIDYASKIRFRGKLPRSYGYRGIETVQWTTHRKTLKLYNKFLEIKKNRDHHEISENDIQDNILRFEEEWRSGYLLRKLGLKSVSELTIGCFLQYMKESYTFEGHMAETFNQFEEKIIFNNVSEIFEFIKVGVHWRKKNSYLQFFSELIANGIDYCKSKYKTSTFYDYKKRFKEIGIDIFKFDDFIRTNQSSNYIPISQYFTREYLYY